MSDQRDTSTKEELSPSDSTAEDAQPSAAADNTAETAAAQDDGTTGAAASDAAESSGDDSEKAGEATEAAATDATTPAASETGDEGAADVSAEATAEASDDSTEADTAQAATGDDDATSDEAATEPAGSDSQAAAGDEATASDQAAATSDDTATEAASDQGKAESDAAETPAAAATTADDAPAAEATPSDSADGAAAGEATKSDGDQETQAADADIAAANPALEPLIKAHEDKTPVEGKVIGWNKGGFHVAIDSIAAFCPVSQIELGNPRSPKRYIDKPFTFMVIEIEKGGRRIVLSRAAALKAAREAKAVMVKDTVKAGAEMSGRVTSITDFGAFVKLMDGVEGLVHISEISRQRVEHPKDVLEVGKEVKVQILKVEKRGERISLSMKRLEADPWKNVAERFPVADPFKGVIRRKTDFGLFVEVEPGLEGLIHTSRLPLGKNMEDENLAVGKEVEGWVHDVDAKRRRLALSLREVPKEQPWRNVEERFPIGNVFQGLVERVADFGAFIQLEPGLTGLLPFSELKLGGGANPKRQYHAGKEVSVRVLSIDQDRKRISLGTESSKAVGTTADYKAYVNKQQKSSSGMGAMAAAFAKLKQP